MEERRSINRINYQAKAVVVVCDTQEKYYVQVANVSPLGMGVHMDADTPDIVKKDIIIVAQTLIMYAKVCRMSKLADGSFDVGIHAQEFSPEILQYLFDHIG